MLGETCPRGFICINHFHALLVLSGVVVIVYYINRNNYQSLYQRINNLNNNGLENIKQKIKIAASFIFQLMRFMVMF